MRLSGQQIYFLSGVWPGICPQERTLGDLFEAQTYLTADQYTRIHRVRGAAKLMAAAVVGNCPLSADTSAAIRKLRECLMTAVAAISLEPRAAEEPTRTPDPVASPVSSAGRQTPK